MNQNKAVLATFLVLLIFCIPSNATPGWSTWSNNVTNDTSYYPHVDHDDWVNFSATSNETIVTWAWYVEGVDQSNNQSYLHEQFGDSGRSNVTVYGTNANGTTDGLTWIVYVGRELETTQITDSEKPDTSAFDDMVSAFDPAETDPIGVFVESTIAPYTDLLGAVFYLFVFGYSIVMQWTRQRSVLMPAVVLLTLAGIIFGLMPEDWKLYAALMVIIGVTSTLWKLYKDRS